ncbi:MAG: NFACT family protein [Dethiobacter sp.]|nr:NFACT family protein [Dethiobacter sp.]
MAYDGITMAAVCRELNEKLVGARVEKIHQPHKLEIYIHLRSRDSQVVLTCSADARLGRVHLTRLKAENPAAAPAFCMLLRKHLGGARLLAVEQSGLDRVLILAFRGYDDFGTETKKYLICEVMGKHSNIILAAGDRNLKQILGSAKIITAQMSRHRTVTPGAPYLPPPLQSKLELHGISEEALAQVLIQQAEGAPEQLLVASVMGIGIEISRELIFRATGGENTHPLDVVRSLTIELRRLDESLRTGSLEPCIAHSPDGRTHICSPIRLTRLPATWLTSYSSVNEALDQYYTDIIQTKNIDEQRNRLHQTAHARFSRIYKKQTLQEKELREMQGADRLRISGEIITANLRAIRPGAREAVLQNFYSPELATISIPLDPSISAQANAQRYFKKYRKLKDGETVLKRRLDETKNELAYLESLLASLEYADLESLQEIRGEMEQSGLMRAVTAKKARQPAVSSPLHFTSAEGIDIYVGRNNMQNDRLTLKTSAPEDTWLHTKDIPGAHVIIKNTDPPEGTLIEAAKLAVRYSRAAASSNVPVDYTHVKHVRKPRGAKPGMVIYSHQRTLYVAADD